MFPYNPPIDGSEGNLTPILGKKAIIVIPGFGGSQLRKSPDKEIVYPCQILNFQIKMLLLYYE